MTVVFVLFRDGTQANVAVEIPYPLFLFAGLVFWFAWADAVASVAASDRMNASLLSKVYFPRLYSPLSLALSRTAKLVIGIVPIALLLLYYGIRPNWHVALLPLVLGQAMLLAFAVGTLFAVLAIGRPEWDNLLSLILYVGLFVSPVIYAARVVPGHVYSLYGLNPMIGTLGAFRATLIGDLPFSWGEWTYSCAFTLAAALAATVFFKRAEARILDEL
jgi:lipopolysaccharide transport system permease protein